MADTVFEMIGMVIFVSTFAVCFGLTYKGYTLLKEKWLDNQESRRKEMLLHKLTPVEYKYLHKFITSQSQTATFILFDGVVAGLIDKGILYKPNAQANKAGEQDFNLYPWAYDYLGIHPEFFIWTAN